MLEFITVPTSGICSFYGEEGGMLLGYEIQNIYLNEIIKKEK